MAAKIPINIQDSLHARLGKKLKRKTRVFKSKPISGTHAAFAQMSGQQHVTCQGLSQGGSGIVKRPSGIEMFLYSASAE